MLQLTITSNPVNVILVTISERPLSMRQAGLRRTPLAVPAHVITRRAVARVVVVKPHSCRLNSKLEFKSDVWGHFVSRQVYS